MKKFTSALAVILSVLMILCSLPMAVMANETTTDYEWIGNPLTIQDGSTSLYNKKVGIQMGDFLDHYLWNGTNNAAGYYTNLGNTNSPDGDYVLQTFMGNHRTNNVKPSVTEEGNNLTASMGSTGTRPWHNVIDVNEPTISGVNGLALYADFSEFKFDEYWRPLTIDNTVTSRAGITMALGNVKGTASSTEVDPSTCAGSHLAYTFGRSTDWNTSTVVVPKTGTATLINTKTGTVETESFTPGLRGGFRVPAGFVGYIFFEFDNKDASEMADLGAFVLYRDPYTIHFNNGTTVEDYFPDVSVTNLNTSTLNYASNYYLGDIYAVSNVNAFALDVLSGKFGGRVATEAACGVNVDGANVSWDAVEGAASYVVSASNTTKPFAQIATATTTETSATLDTDVSAASVKVIALNAEGAVIGVKGTHNWKSVVQKPTPTEPGINKKVCANCGAEGEVTVIPATGYIGEVNGATSKSVTLGRDGKTTYFSYGSYTTSSCPKYGPSTYYTKLQYWSYGGVIAKTSLKYAEALAFYIDTYCTNFFKNSTYPDGFTVENNTLDISFRTVDTTKYLNIESGSTTINSTKNNDTGNNKYVIGALGGGTSYSANRHGVEVKFYDARTGEITNATYRSEGGELIVPTNFIGYVILDLTNYDNFVPLENVTEICIERTSGDDPVTADATVVSNGIAGYGFDNFTPLYDVSDVLANADDYFTKSGTLYPTSGVKVSASAAEGVLTVTPDAGIVPTTYNLYQVAEDGDTLTRIDTNSTGTFDVLEGTYYVQAVVEGETGYQASNVAKVLYCEHIWGDPVVTKEPTCGKPGKQTYTCILCESTMDENLPATGEHTWDEGVVTTEPGCITDGVKTFTCSVCNDTKTEAIPANGQHSYGEIQTKPSTCIELGYTYKVCSICKDEVKVEDLKEYGEHVKGAVVTVVPPTTEADGYTVYKCSVCEQNFNADFVEKLAATDDGITYETYLDGIKITGYVGKSTEVTIPAQIGGKNVLAIAGGAFADAELTVVNYNAVNAFCEGTNVNPVFKAKQKFIVNIGAEVTAIPGYLFYGAYVTELNFAEGAVVTTIGEYAFVSNRIVDLVLPDSVVTIEAAAFRAGTAMKSFKAGAGLKTIEGHAFTLCSNLADIKLNEGLVKINNAAFTKIATAVEAPVNVLIPFSVDYIGRSTDPFKGANVNVTCYTNSYADIWYAPATSIGYFYTVLNENDFVVEDVEGGVKIVSYTGEYSEYMEIPATIGGKPVVEIGYKVFCNGVANRVTYAVKAPETVKVIGAEAFRAMLALRTFEAPGATDFGKLAFVFCNNLETVDAADDVELNIHEKAFRDILDQVTFR